MKLERPNKIAVCFVDGNPERTEQQIDSLREVENHFEIEWVRRSDIFTQPYISFSQAVNECVVNSESEFMVFINPKTIVSPEDIITIIDDLCNGFAWSSICSFGLWGTTKELFRRIGLMDERFIGGEYEDDDFAVRMKQFDVAINWRFILDKYPYTEFHHRPALKGITFGKYEMKWLRIDEVYYRTDIIPGEKQLPPKIKNNAREDIYNSWKKWNESESDEISHVFRNANNAVISNKIVTSAKVKSIARLIFDEGQDGKARISFNCGANTKVHIVMTNALPIGAEGTTAYVVKVLGKDVKHSFDLEHGLYDIRVFHQGELILNNTAFLFPGSVEYVLGINVAHFNLDI